MVTGRSLKILLVAAIVNLPMVGFPQSANVARIAEGDLRRWATKTVTPAFPADALLKHKTGVAVAELQVDEHGHVSRVTVLESPSESTKESLTKALAQWQFAPATFDGQPIKFVGKVTFYFLLREGKGVVLSPRPVDGLYVEH